MKFRPTSRRGAFPGGHPNSELKAEPVVGEKGVFGQLLLSGHVTEIVAEVREVGLPWTEPLGQSETLDHVHVGRVRSAAGSPENQSFDSLQCFEPGGVHLLAVTQIGYEGAPLLAKKKT
jgi:hypothetical protein